MATATYSALGTSSGNIASTVLDSLANGSSSSAITYDNSTNLNLYAAIAIELGSFTSTAGASITVSIYAVAASVTPDLTGGAQARQYTVPLTVGASAKAVVIPRVELFPFSCRVVVTNNSGAALASSGNTLAVVPYGEEIEDPA